MRFETPQDEVLPKLTRFTINALRSIDAGQLTLTSSEMAELRARGWINPLGESLQITPQGRLLLERLLVAELLEDELR